MSDEENKNNTDLFSGADVKPLFSDDGAAEPVGKPLFQNTPVEQDDSVPVKPLFQPEVNSTEPDIVPEPEISSYQTEPESAENVSLEDFREFESYDDSPENEAEPERIPDAETSVAPAEATQVPAEPAKQMNIPRPPVKQVSVSGNLESMTLGSLMTLAREAAGFSYEDVYNGTKISIKYMKAIEQDRFDDLPSGVFPGAYVRALCAFYHLEPSALEIARKKAAAYCSVCRPPDNVYEHLPDHAQINMEERAKFRRWVIITGTVFCLLIVLILSLVITFSLPDKKTEAVQSSPVSMESLEKLSGPQMPVMRKLNVPGR